MQLAMELARKGIGAVEPNPAVGCVIVSGDEIIGRGWHEKFGGAHAEINAIADCKANGADIAGATMYVTLEPCCHHGKTGPCSDAVIAAGVGKVVVAMVDPSGHAAGKGIEQLRAAGIEVETGVCEKESILLNAAFVKFAKTCRCWVVLKWAQSKDGKMSCAEGTGKRWISNEESRDDVHQLRRQMGGILVGIDTVLADDPLLTARPAGHRKLVRVVLDSGFRIPVDCKLIATAKDEPVLIAAGHKAIETDCGKYEAIRKAGAEVLEVGMVDGRCDIGEVLEELNDRGIDSLLVEGGAKVITSFIEEKLYDEAVVYVGGDELGADGDVEVSGAMAKLLAGGLRNSETVNFGGDVRISGLSENAVKEILGQ